MERLSDTPPAIERIQIELIRQSPSWKRAHQFGQMYLTVKQLALAGLRVRYPNSDESELKRRLADLFLGAELAEKVYGPLKDPEPVHAV